MQKQNNIKEYEEIVNMKLCSEEYSKKIIDMENRSKELDQLYGLKLKEKNLIRKINDIKTCSKELDQNKKYEELS